MEKVIKLIIKSLKQACNQKKKNYCLGLKIYFLLKTLSNFMKKSNIYHLMCIQRKDRLIFLFQYVLIIILAVLALGHHSMKVV